MKQTRRKPLYTFNSLNDTGINDVPDNSIIAVLDGIEFKLYECISTTGTSDTTTILQFLNMSGSHEEFIATSSDGLRTTFPSKADMLAAVPKDFNLIKTLDDGKVYIFEVSSIVLNHPAEWIRDVGGTGYYKPVVEAGKEIVDWVATTAFIKNTIVIDPTDEKAYRVKADYISTTAVATDLLNDSIILIGSSTSVTSLRIDPVADEAGLKAINAKHFMITKREDTGDEYVFEETDPSLHSSFDLVYGGSSTPPVGIPDNAGLGNWFLYNPQRMYRIKITGLNESVNLDTFHPEPLRDNTLVWVNEILQQNLLVYTLSGSIVTFKGSLEIDDVVIITANPK